MRNIFDKYYLLLVFVRDMVFYICLSRVCIPTRLFLIINVNKKILRHRKYEAWNTFRTMSDIYIYLYSYEFIFLMV